MILSLTSWSLAVALYAIKDLQSHGKLRWMGNDYGFWGRLSWTRKYKDHKSLRGPAFPLSTTALVFVTDGYHFCQFLFTILFSISAVSYEREFGFWIDLGIYWGVWHIVFPITYKVFGK